MVEYLESTDLDRIFAALADPTRRSLVRSLARGPSTVSELAEPFDLTLAGVSKHLRVLHRAGLIDQRRQGRQVACALRPDALRSVITWAERTERFWADCLARLEAVVLDAPIEDETSREGAKP